jgi:hypothetical protein
MTLRDLYVKHGYVANLRQLSDYIEFMKDSCKRIDGGSDLCKQLDSIVRAHSLRITDLFPGGSQAICVENALDKRLLFKRGEYHQLENSLEPNGSQIFLVYRVSKDNIYNLGPNPSTPTHRNDKGQQWHITGDGRHYYCIDFDVLLWRHHWAYEKYRAVALAMLAVCIGGIETGLDLIDSAPSATKALEHLRRNARLYVQIVQPETDSQNPQRQGKFIREICLNVSKLSERLCLLITKIAKQIAVDQALDRNHQELHWIYERLRILPCFQRAADTKKVNRRAVVDGVEWIEFEMMFFPRTGFVYYANKVRSC